MHRLGHYGMALLLYAPLVIAVHQYQPVLLLPSVAGAVIVSKLCMLPDKDQNLPLIKHRGFTHTIWFALILAGLFGFLGFAVVNTAASVVDISSSVVQFTAVASAFLGFHIVVSHVMADILTPMGITPFVPLSGRTYALGIVKASNPVANGALALLGLVALGYAYAFPYL